MFRSILVPLDGSSFGEQALPLAHTIAVKSGAGLHLVHVHVPQEVMFGEPVLFVPPGVDTVVKQQRLTYLQGVAQRLAGLSTPTSAVVLEGAVAPSLQDHAGTIKADLVVMTTHGRGPLSRAWFGSVTDDLMRKLDVPLLLVRPEEQIADPALPISVRHMLIALDGSPLAEQILPSASEIARVLGADCTLVRVMPPLVRGQTDSVDVTLSHLDRELLDKLNQLHEEEHSKATKYLEAKCAELQARSLNVQSRLVVHEQPATALLEEAKKISADLVALATHGRSGIPRLFLGSTADKVARGVHCPVLMYRPKRSS